MESMFAKFWLTSFVNAPLFDRYRTFNRIIVFCSVFGQQSYPLLEIMNFVTDTEYNFFGVLKRKLGPAWSQ